MASWFRFFYSQFFVKPALPTASFAGQYIVVTGSNVGLGKEAARHLARLGASKVILAVRNGQAGADAKTDIETSIPECDPAVLEVWPLDLESSKSIEAFAERAFSLPRVDVLLENAGIATHHFATAAGTGNERTIQVNVIGTFLLLLLLLPKLKATAKQYKVQPRATIVSSEVHAWTKFPERKEPRIFAALNDSAKTNMGERYHTSKLMEVLLVRQLAPKLEGSGVILNMLNPGLCHSELMRDRGKGPGIFKAVVARTTEVGSRTLVAAAVAGQESHGKYMYNGKVAEETLSAFARSEEGQRAGAQLWKELRELLDRIHPGVTCNL